MDKVIDRINDLDGRQGRIALKALWESFKEVEIKNSQKKRAQHLISHILDVAESYPQERACV